jgi:ferredoxin
MKTFFLSATGNSLYVARELGGTLYSIPKVLRSGQTYFADKKITIVFPCYYWGTPRLVKEFLEKVTLKADYLAVVMTYGGTAVGGLWHFQKFARRQNLRIAYAREILMVDNYLPFFDIAKELKNEPAKKIEANLRRIVVEISRNKHSIEKTPLTKQLLTLLAQFFFNRSHAKDDRKFSVSNKCTGCSICALVCPVKNIQIVEQRPVYQHHCELCLACINLCPEKAIRFRKEPGTARFKNPHVSLQDLMAANQ